MDDMGAKVDRDLIIRRIGELPAEEFVDDYIIDCVPWIFPERREYVRWKRELAAGLDVDSYSILIVGSSCVGVSLSPRKSFSKFHANSDIDVAVVSPYHFDIAWRWLRSLALSERINMTSFEREMFDWHRKNLVFNGTIATERILGKLSFGPNWKTALSRASKNPPIDGKEVKARIYRDFESLRFYQASSVRKAAAELSAARLG
jgi:hypothetical protein